MLVQWQWKNEQSWESYAPLLNDMIERSYQNNDTIYEFEIKGKEYYINFADSFGLRQVSKSNFKKWRRIRRKVYHWKVIIYKRFYNIDGYLYVKSKEKFIKLQEYPTINGTIFLLKGNTGYIRVFPKEN